MPNDQASSLTGLKSENIEARSCPGCGASFPAGGRGMGKSFCSDTCRRRFHNGHTANGQVLGPLVKAWHATRHAKPGTREAAICSFARGQLTQIARTLLDEDGEAGRDVVAYVGGLMDSGMLWADRRR